MAMSLTSDLGNPGEYELSELALGFLLFFLILLAATALVWCVITFIQKIRKPLGAPVPGASLTDGLN